MMSRWWADIAADGIVPGTATAEEFLAQVAGTVSNGKRPGRRPYVRRLPGELRYLTAREVEILRTLTGGVAPPTSRSLTR